MQKKQVKKDKKKKVVPKISNSVGRPKSIGKEELEKLEYAFSIGATPKEAILHADVKSSTFYDYVRDNPEFSERIELLREKTPLKARIVVDNALDIGDVNTAKWLLERNKRAEFSTQQNVDHTTKGDKINVEELTTEELIKRAEIVRKIENES